MTGELQEILLSEIIQATAKFKRGRKNLVKSGTKVLNEWFPNTTCITAVCSVIDIVSWAPSGELRSSEDSEIDYPFHFYRFISKQSLDVNEDIPNERYEAKTAY